MSIIKSGIESTRVKKLIFSIVAFGILIGFTSPTYQPNDFIKLGLKGNVKSLREIQYSAAEEGDTTIKDKIISEKYTVFNTDGYETEYSIYKNGHKVSFSKYLFGTDGKQVELNEYNPDGTLHKTIAYKYDNKGFRIEATCIWSAQQQSNENREKSDYSFDFFNPNLFTRVLYKNDFIGLCLEEKYLNSDSSIAYKNTYRYDFRGNKVESVYYNSSGKRSWNAKYKYDQNNNMIECRIFKSDRIAVKSTYKYLFDLNQNWVSRIEDKEINLNIFTSRLDSASIITERKIEYY